MARPRPQIAGFPTSQKVVAAGSGIARFCCAYDLLKEGFGVVVMKVAGDGREHNFNVAADLMMDAAPDLLQLAGHHFSVDPDQA